VAREQRLVFGEDAELYDRARPGYSDALVDDVLEYGGMDPAASHALEIGAGTGKATVAFAARGFRVVAVEPDPAMAALAARNAAPFPHVRVEHAAFEDWPVDDDTVDLVFSGQAWHWVRPEVRGVKAAAALRPDGVLALFWHRTHWRDDDPLRSDFDACYRLHAPELYARGPGFPGLEPNPERREHEELDESDAFFDVTVRHHPWEARHDADSFAALLSTQSDHRLLPEAERARLLEAVRGVVADHGGTITVPYDTLLVLARADK
jgi:SAM-dependent methyltransferase